MFRRSGAAALNSAVSSPHSPSLNPSCDAEAGICNTFSTSLQGPQQGQQQQQGGEEEVRLLPKTKKLRGLLQLLHGQITNHITSCAASNRNTTEPVLLYNYNQHILHNTQLDFQKGRRRRRRKKQRRWHDHNNDVVVDEMGKTTDDDIEMKKILHRYRDSNQTVSFSSIVNKHRFVCFFIVQGYHYCKHTLNLRQILATDYHDVISTFVIDTVTCTTKPIILNYTNNNEKGDGSIHSTMDDTIDNIENGNSDIISNNNHNCKENEEVFTDLSNDNDDSFCKGTGFAKFPLSHHNLSNVLALLNVTKIPSLVIIDTITGQTVSRDAILSIENNDCHTVINRWQMGKSGLSFTQQVCAHVTCQSEYSCCTIQ